MIVKSINQALGHLAQSFLVTEVGQGAKVVYSATYYDRSERKAKERVTMAKLTNAGYGVSNCGNMLVVRKMA